MSDRLWQSVLLLVAVAPSSCCLVRLVRRGIPAELTSDHCSLEFDEWVSIQWKLFTLLGQHKSWSLAVRWEPGNLLRGQSKWPMRVTCV